MKRDLEHLKLLTISHYIVAGLTAILASLPLVHVVVGLRFVLSPQPAGLAPHGPPPAFFGWLLVAAGGFFVLMGWTMASLIFCAARCLQQRKDRTYCVTAAAISCVVFPYGTVLGVFTIIVLSRDSVKKIFADSSAPSLSGAI